MLWPHHSQMRLGDGEAHVQWQLVLANGRAGVRSHAVSLLTLPWSRPHLLKTVIAEKSSLAFS